MLYLILQSLADKQTSPEMPETNQTQDIDLLDLVVKVSQFFRKHLLLFAIASVAGALIGFAVFRIKTKEYKANIVATFQSFEDGRLIELADDLNQLIIDNDIQTLAKLTHLTEEQARLINEFDVQSYYEMEKKAKKLNDDKMELYKSSVVKITISVSDTAAFKWAQQGFNYYVSHLPYSVESIALLRSGYEDQIRQLDHRIQKADSVSTLMEDRMIRANGTIILSDQGAGQASALYGLTKLRVELQQQLDLLQEMRIIKPYTVFKKARWPKLSIALLVGVLLADLGTILGILILGPRFKK